MGLELSRKEIKHYKDDVEADFQTLLRSPKFMSRPSSKQWQFFKHLFGVTMGRATGNFDCEANHAVNYKFEINERLRLYYLDFGKSAEFVFRIVNVKKAGTDSPVTGVYPRSNGYALQIFFNKQDPDSLQIAKLSIEKTIGKAVALEFAAYEGLSEADLDNLATVFDRTSSAFKRIANVVRTHRDKRGWVLTNPDNPSTTRLVDVQVKDITDKSAQVRTTEYWLLMWWDVKANGYPHYYNETSRQIYFLARRRKRWVIVDNPYPRPTTSTPRRNIRRFQQRLTKGSP